MLVRVQSWAPRAISLTCRRAGPDDARVAWRVSVSAIALASALLAGCSSGWVKLAPLPPPTYEPLGRVEGKACGSLALGYGAYAFLPIMLNSRLERARDE